jgi:hypothetical protein
VDEFSRAKTSHRSLDKLVVARTEEWAIGVLDGERIVGGAHAQQG